MEMNKKNSLDQTMLMLICEHAPKILRREDGFI